MPAAKRKPGHGGRRPGAGRPVTTGSGVSPPIVYRVSTDERMLLSERALPGESINATAKRLALSCP